MKVLYDLIREMDPEDLWHSLNLTALSITMERLDAFLAVYKKILETEPCNQTAVLTRVEIRQKNTAFVIIQQISGMPKTVPIELSRLEDLLGFYIPATLEEICHSTVICVLFRCLITEELQKPEYRISQLRRDLAGDIGGFREWEYRCSNNRKNLLRDMKKYKEKSLLKEIRRECDEQFPQMGTCFYWDSLIREAVFTEEFCRALFPANPPSLSGLYDAKRKIEREIDRIMNGTAMCFLEYGSIEEKNRLCHSELQICAEKAIIVGYNHIPGMNIPIIYKVDPKGRRSEIQPEDLSNPLSCNIVVQDQRLLRDMKLLVGYVLLYLAYPLRMHREIRSCQLQQITYLLNERMKSKNYKRNRGEEDLKNI